MDSLTLFALILFAVTYILMFSLQKLRPYIAAVSALIFVVVGSLGVFPSFAYTWRDALSQIDWNVIMMIAGTMGTVYLFIESKMPQKLSDIIITKVSTVKWIIVTLSLFAGIISAFVDNVATVLMIAPVAVALCRKLEISPVTAIICISISSNLQGAATLVGDTTSILLGKAANLDFMDFFFVQGKPGMFWVTEAGALVSALIILWMCRKDNKRVHVSEVTEVKDIVPTLLLVLFVAITSLVTLAFYHICAKGVDYDRRFMIKCDKAMEKGASVGAVCECSAAYLYSPRRVACVGGVYSPELQTPLGTSPFDILKNRSETRFDYWYNEGALWGMMSSNEVERLGVRLADDGRLRALMRADWTPFDAALEAPRYDGWSLTDTVDVGYAPDERRVGFEVLGRKRRHVHPYFHLFNDESTGRVIADSGVCAKEGVALTVDPPPGSEWMIAVRIVDEECEQRLEGFRVRYEGAADPSCFRTVVVNADRPVTAAGPTRLFLRGEFSPAVIWIYSRASLPAD